MKLLIGALALAASAVAHEVHVSNARAAFDGSSLYVRVQLFREDLQVALREQGKQPNFVLSAQPAADSLFLSYARAKFVLRQNGRALAPVLIGSGEAKGQKPELDIWYYDLRFDLAPDSRALEIRYELLFERYRDQRNVFKVKLPTGKERTLFFVPGDGVYRLAW